MLAAVTPEGSVLSVELVSVVGWQADIATQAVRTIDDKTRIMFSPYTIFCIGLARKSILSKAIYIAPYFTLYSLSGI